MEPCVEGSDAFLREREQQLAKCGELRKMFNDTGVNTHIYKTVLWQSDEEIEFSFLVERRWAAPA